MVVALWVLATGCSVGQQLDDADPSAERDSRVASELDVADYPGLDEADIDSALAYFSRLEPGPEGAELPESATANRMVGGCLEDFGVAVSYAGAGGVYRRSNPEQQARGDALIALCFDVMAQKGLINVDDRDPDMAIRRYEAYLVAYQCLVQLGEDVEEPPTLEAFLDGHSWTPFDGISNLVNSDAGRLEGPGVDCGIP